jgi:hypothetical protein
MKAYTDLKQSKKLAEFLPLESADMHYATWTILDGNFIVSPNQGSTIKSLQEDYGNQIIPCWSLASLMNLLPSEFTEVGKYSTTKYEIHIRKYKFTDDTDLHQIAYGNYKIYEDGSSSWKDMINTGEREELLDAVFDMIVWLKENGKI